MLIGSLINMLQLCGASGGRKYIIDDLREFAQDTTVILAQPRVSRLRAASGYVDSWGSVGRTLDR